MATDQSQAETEGCVGVSQVDIEVRGYMSCCSEENKGILGRWHSARFSNSRWLSVAGGNLGRNEH